MVSTVHSAFSRSPIRVVVLGGGVSGLAAAHSLIGSRRSNQLSVTLLESDSKFGGWVNTKTYQDGCFFELGPRTVRPVGIPGRRTLMLVSELGLEHKIIPVNYNHSIVSRRYIYAKGKINLMPNSLWTVCTRQPPLRKSILSAILREPFQPASLQDDESVYDFFKRRMGAEIADYFVDAFCYGIYASGAKELSMATCFPSFVKYEKESGSLLMGALQSRKEKKDIPGCPLFDKSQKERWRSWTLQNGLQELTDKWAAHVKKCGVNLKLDTRCTLLETTPDKKILCHTENGIIEADHIISSLSSPCLASLLPGDCEKLKTYLNSIPSVSVAVVNLEFKGKVLPMEGFGFLVPSCESKDILGVVFDSCVYDGGRENTKITVMLGGSNFCRLFGNPDYSDQDYILHVALKNVQEILGINVDPLKYLVSVQKNCIPQYQVGHLKTIDSIYREIDDKNLPLTVVGSSYKAVGLNDCIYNSQIETKQLIQKIFR